jgi:hypothetical protein
MSRFTGTARREVADDEGDAELGLFLLAATDTVEEDGFPGRAADDDARSRSGRTVAVSVARLVRRGQDSAGGARRFASLPRQWCAGDLFGLATLPLRPGRPSQTR